MPGQSAFAVGFGIVEVSHRDTNAGIVIFSVASEIVKIRTIIGNGDSSISYVARSRIEGSQDHVVFGSGGSLLRRPFSRFGFFEGGS
jgi:hypothetical protein